ncbi:unnamed protein product [Cylicostephanus goldi]|uniref:HTH cro/C1-type domain-containing protein n=1 Tax=Cylicostephanus goldi TaxID=71465 RepID=A0A3P7NJ20_CYLGO|nr:unnamed protein product [Cylicostephanus goldi]
MEDIGIQIGKDLKRFRTRCGMSVDEVGASVGASGEDVSAWEAGQEFDGETLVKLCRLYDVDFSDFHIERGTHTDTKDEG